MAPLRNTDKDPQPGSSIASAAAGSGAEPKQRRKPGRVPVSCAECRRLKLRCDRQVPCESCTKRGCAALCPDGSLPTTKGPKLKAAAEVEELKDKIATLEAALMEMQKAVSKEPHPLLRDNPAVAAESASESSPSGSSGAASGSDGSHSPNDDRAEDEEQVLNSFGTLTLGTRGEARFFGQTSRTEYLIHAPERLTPFLDLVKLPRLSPVTVTEACMEVDVFCTNELVAEDVRLCMPTMEEALRLCDIYFECAKFIWYPLPREYVYTEIVSFIYQPPTGDYCHVTKKHALSLLFMIFSLATLFDANMPPYSAEAMEYCLLARIALRWAPPTYDTTLPAIQSMIYMVQYMELSDCEPAHTGGHKAWVLGRTTLTLGYSIGLHVGGAKWQLEEAAIAKRSRVFWQIFTQDTWLSFGFGRPPSVNLAFVDCEIPKPEDIGTSDGRQWSTEYHVWTWHFAKLMHDVTSTAFAAKRPTYAKVMELDKRIRDFSEPKCLQPLQDETLSEQSQDNVARTMQTLMVTLMKDTTHLNLHRPYLSQALQDSPEDPVRHKFGASVMIIYRSAWRILNALHQAHNTAPVVTARISVPWSQALACSILLCIIITRAPTSPLASPALMELDKICALFEEAANKSQIATNNIHVLRTLRKQAHAAITKVLAADAALVSSELDRLGGRTQLIQTVHDIGRMGCRIPISNCVGYGDPKDRARLQASAGVFQDANTSSFVHGMVAQDSQVFDDLPDPLGGNQSAFDAGMMNFDFASGELFDPSQMSQQEQQMQSEGQEQPIDFSQLQNADWFVGLFNEAQQSQAASEPVPSTAEMDATWQALVSQLGI